MSTFHGWQCDECGERVERSGLKSGADADFPSGWTQFYAKVGFTSDVPRCMNGWHTFCSPSCTTAWITDTPRRERLEFEAQMKANRAADVAREATLQGVRRAA